MASYSASIGTSDTVAPHPSLHELVVRFAFGKLSRAPARFDVEELRALNAKLLHALPYEIVAPRLLAMGIGGGEEFLAARALQSRRSLRCLRLVAGGGWPASAGDRRCRVVRRGCRASAA